MSHRHKKINFGKLVNGIGKGVVKPAWKEATHIANAPTQLAGDLIHSSGNLALPLMIVGGIALVIFLKNK